MAKRWHLGAGLALALLSGIGGAPARARSGPDAPAPRVSARQVHTIEAMLWSADVPGLDAIYRHPPDPATRVLAAMALERTHFNLEQASKDADICENALRDSQPQVALFCARFANGDLRLQQGDHAANPDELDIVARLTGKAPEKALQRMRDWVAQQPVLPPLRVAVPASGARIDLDTTIIRGLESVQVHAGGRSAWLGLDSGSSGITLDAATARHLGVRLLQHTARAAGLVSRDVPVRLGVLPSLRIGDVEVDNAPVNVIPSGPRLIGMDVLRRLGAFRLSRHQLQVFGESQSLPPCQQPLLVATDLFGNWVRVVVPLSIGDHLRTALLDTGSGWYLSAVGHPDDPLRIRYTGTTNLRDYGSHGHQPVTSQATVRVTISGQPFQLALPVFRNARLPWPYILGSGALRDMDFFVDFRNRHACLLLHDDLH